ncbi:hypothetical protein ACIPLR_24595, partial [Herbaspirillum huttiense]
TDRATVQRLAAEIGLQQQMLYAGHKHKVLDNWAASRAKFVKVFPTEYKRALAELAAAAETKKEKVAA